MWLPGVQDSRSHNAPVSRAPGSHDSRVAQTPADQDSPVSWIPEMCIVPCLVNHIKVKKKLPCANDNPLTTLSLHPLHHGNSCVIVSRYLVWHYDKPPLNQITFVTQPKNNPQMVNSTLFLQFFHLFKTNHRYMYVFW